jgi:formylglycine-generating enzyme required for sulfatase activity
MRCIDFCDAEAYCRWTDKHLCYDRASLGNQGPSGVPPEWLLGCTNSRATVYPWGNVAADGACNFGQTASRCVADSPTCGPHVEGGITTCKNARGVLDQLGNVAEWVFSCTFVDSEHPLQPTRCLTRGGGYDDPPQACSFERTISADSRTPSLGFRCCSDLTAAEQVKVATQ